MSNKSATFRHSVICLTLGVSFAQGLVGCRVYGYLLGYPVEPKATSYRYYDPEFAAHNVANLRSSYLKTNGFYCESGANNQQVIRPAIRVNGEAKLDRSFEYFKFNPDGSFHLVNVSIPISEIRGLFMRVKPTGYYKIAGDTVWLEVRNAANKKGPIFGYAVLRADSVKVNLPDLASGGVKYLLYHN